ncbi:MAG: hypothetical protein JNL38_21105 [Myxococcales bacterium]|nr:hypothetical protein [Myxococcales bacterium]
MSARRAAVLVGGGFLFAAGCQAIADIEDRSHAAPAADATVEASPAPDAAVEAGPACDPLHPPPPPSPPSAGPSLDFTFALDSVEIDRTDVGYDLDQRCTCAPSPSDPGSCVSATPRCDGPRGVDNALGAVTKAALGGSFATDNLKRSITDGTVGALLSLQGYNGLVDDDAVAVTLFASNGTTDADGGPDRPKPAFRGQDIWTVDPESYNDPDAGPPSGAKFAVPAAYVANGTVVARATTAYVGLGDLVLRITDATLTGEVQRAVHPYRILSGRITGRITSAALLNAIQSLKVGAFSLCAGSELFAAARQAVCEHRDLSSDPSRDGKGDRCDALSVGISFTATEAVLGPLRPREVDPTPCDGGAEAVSCP